MTVYVLSYEIDYETWVPLGVFASADGARRAAQEHAHRDPCQKGLPPLAWEAGGEVARPFKDACYVLTPFEVLP